MKLNYINSPRKNWTAATISAMLILTSPLARAQEGSQGNTTIFGGAEMTFFADHNFATGGGGAQPGVILTERAAGSFGVLNFSGTNLVSTNASDAGYVDGYVRKYGTGQFIFPVGDNGNLGQFAASGDGTMGAYFHSDPNTAVTSNLFTGTNYTALPSGGPFATTSTGANVDVVSTVEYWDVDGSSTTPLTLTWDAGSNIAGLTGSQLTKLTIVGWNGTQWVAIASKVDVTSVLGGSSDLPAGSITTTATITPNTYTAYTFGSLNAPLPVTLTSFKATAENSTALLTWTTTAEANSDRFEVEHSLNGKNWNRIGIVASYGESKVLRSYSFVDANPARGENLYRLKMVDKDETFAYSKIRNVTFETGAEITTYPNPVIDKLLISNYAKVKQMSLNNTSGTKLLQKEKVSSEGVDVSNLKPGIYIVTLTLFDGTISTHKVAVTR
ncbi:T9SS type A sorting domain-containing protein [Dyadobacter diqingensis]|uniref:T9SS type A sorting domain-containing protein n=1 Tax=Dyadobacter diqingensis TaxID=2938121 RepID=UPI0020C26E12|nr:T9SS type A sorting domain-containing protein [Dyadobacter diqingensis]